jgi:hypothetical protein
MNGSEKMSRSHAPALADLIASPHSAESGNCSPSTICKRDVTQTLYRSSQESNRPMAHAASSVSLAEIIEAAVRSAGGYERLASALDVDEAFLRECAAGTRKTPFALAVHLVQIAGQVSPPHAEPAATRTTSARR